MEHGRPPLFSTPEFMEEKIKEYFDSLKGTEEPVTITGLCLFLGFESRQSFYDYEKREGFSYTVKRARMRVENSYEQSLRGNNVAGPVFALKNLGWADRQEIDQRIVMEQQLFGDDDE